MGDVVMGPPPSWGVGAWWVEMLCRCNIVASKGEAGPQFVEKTPMPCHRHLCFDAATKATTKVFPPDVEDSMSDV